MIDSVSSDDQLHERLDEGRLGHETKKFPIVFLSLKGVDGLTFDLAYQALYGIIVEEFSRLRFLAASDKLAADEKQYFKKILNGKYEEADIIGS